MQCCRIAIAEIIISGDQLLLDRGDRFVANELDARVSIHHCAAVSFSCSGRPGYSEVSDDTVRAPAVTAFRDRIKPRLNPEVPEAPQRPRSAPRTVGP